MSRGSFNPWNGQPKKGLASKVYISLVNLKFSPSNKPQRHSSPLLINPSPTLKQNAILSTSGNALSPPLYRGPLRYYLDQCRTKRGQYPRFPPLFLPPKCLETRTIFLPKRDDEHSFRELVIILGHAVGGKNDKICGDAKDFCCDVNSRRNFVEGLTTPGYAKTYVFLFMASTSSSLSTLSSF
jgi:hypothetical protein